MLTAVLPQYTVWNFNCNKVKCRDFKKSFTKVQKINSFSKFSF